MCSTTSQEVNTCAGRGHTESLARYAQQQQHTQKTTVEWGEEKKGGKSAQALYTQKAVHQPTVCAHCTNHLLFVDRDPPQAGRIVRYTQGQSTKSTSARKRRGDEIADVFIKNTPLNRH